MLKKYAYKYNFNGIEKANFVLGESLEEAKTQLSALCYDIAEAEIIPDCRERKIKKVVKDPKFIIKRARHDKFYFVLTAKNGQVIAQSETYNSKDAAKNGIELVKNNAPIAEIDDQTEAL